MAYKVEQIDKGPVRNYITPGQKKRNKKALHKQQRLRSKANFDYTPQYNRYSNGWAI